MASCEKCYEDAQRIMRLTGKPVEVVYAQLLKERADNPCSPKEQAGQFWDETTQSDKRFSNPPQQGEKHTKG